MLPSDRYVYRAPHPPVGSYLGSAFIARNSLKSYSSQTTTPQDSIVRYGLNYYRPPAFPLTSTFLSGSRNRNMSTNAAHPDYRQTPEIRPSVARSMAQLAGYSRGRLHTLGIDWSARRCKGVILKRHKGQKPAANDFLLRIDMVDYTLIT